MAKKTTRKSTKKQLAFRNKLVLNQWRIFSAFYQGFYLGDCFGQVVVRVGHAFRLTCLAEARPTGAAELGRVLIAHK